MRYGCLTTTYTQWRLKTQSKLQLKNSMLVAISKWRKNTIDITLKAWQLLSRHINIELLSMLNLAIHKISKRKMIQTWLTWRSRLIHKKSLQAMMAQAIYRRAHSSKKMIFNIWKQEAHQRSILKFRALQGFNMNKMVVVFKMWALRVKRNKRLRVSLKALLYKVLKERLTLSFYTWRENAKTFNHQRRIVSIAVARLKHQVSSCPKGLFLYAVAAPWRISAYAGAGKCIQNYYVCLVPSRHYRM